MLSCNTSLFSNSLTGWPWGRIPWLPSLPAQSNLRSFGQAIKSTIFGPGNQISNLLASQSNPNLWACAIKSPIKSLLKDMRRLSVADCVDILTKCAAVIKDLIRGGICLLSAVGKKKFFFCIYTKKILLATADNENDNISTDFTNDNKNYAKSLISSGLSWIFGNKWQRFHRILKQEVKQGATDLFADVL